MERQPPPGYTVWNAENESSTAPFWMVRHPWLG